MFYKLSFVRKQHEVDDIYTFFFTRPANMPHKAGKYAIFCLPWLYRPHPFSISSSPDEPYITITTRTNTGSRFKKRLLAMRPNNTMFCIGPIMNFTFRPNKSHYVFLAQGIGITPFRSMLVYAKKHLPNITTTLIHVAGGQPPFKELTQQLATSAYYPTNPDDFSPQVAKCNTGQLFYISGSPAFVRSTKTLLRNKGVTRQNIITDSFWGY